MPDARCPTCCRWSSRQDSETVLPGEFPFVIRCRSCGAEADIHDVGFRMTISAIEPLPDAWAAGQGIPG